MKKKFQICLSAVLLLFAIPGMSQMNNTVSTVAASQLKMLMQLKGVWETNAAMMQAGGKEYKFAYYTDFRVVSDNNGIAMHEWATIPRIGKRDGNNLMGVNMYDGKIHWYTVDNMGITHEHVGEFSDNKHFSMMHKSMQDGKEYMEMITIEFAMTDILTLKQVNTLDGEETAVITGTFHRKKM